jgi:hypothetical protein
VENVQGERRKDDKGTKGIKEVREEDIKQLPVEYDRALFEFIQKHSELTTTMKWVTCMSVHFYLLTSQISFVIQFVQSVPKVTVQ